MRGSAIACNRISKPLYERIKPKKRIIFSLGGKFNFFLASSFDIASPKISYKGWFTRQAGLFFSNTLKSFITFSLMVINASQLFRKNRVKVRSPGRCSWGIILSAIQIIFVCRFFFILRKIFPSATPKKGIQKRTTTISGFSLLSCFPTLIQFNGFIELISGFTSIPSGAGSSEYCVLPGKKNDGYCSEKEQILQLCPDSKNSLASL